MEAHKATIPVFRGSMFGITSEEEAHAFLKKNAAFQDVYRDTLVLPINNEAFLKSGVSSIDTK